MAAKKPKIIVSCFNCGEEKEVWPSVYARNTTGRFFCSAECRNIVGVKPRTIKDKLCDNCGEFFRPLQNFSKGKEQRFCSKQCTVEWQRRDSVSKNCAYCTILFVVAPSMPNIFCSRECYDKDRTEKSYGNRKLTSDGYINIYLPDREDAQPSTGRVMEHRAVMADFIGRTLLPEEEVHHKNGVRNDNRLENLELWSHSQPAGQRIEDKVRWAKEIIALYRPIEGLL